jgi:hypothetical protein
LDSLLKPFKAEIVKGFGRKHESGWIEVGSIVEAANYDPNPTFGTRQEAKVETIFVDPFRGDHETHPESDETQYPPTMTKVAAGIALILAGFLVSLSLVLRD